MENTEKLQLLSEMLEVSVAELSENKPLDTIPTWDSMAALSLICLLEEQFNRTDIDGSQIREMRTVADILKVME